MRSYCPICTKPLVELERWTITMADWDLKWLATVDRAPTVTERERLEGTLGDWRSVYCPDHPSAVGFLAERID